MSLHWPLHKVCPAQVQRPPTEIGAGLDVLGTVLAPSWSKKFCPQHTTPPVESAAQV